MICYKDTSYQGGCYGLRQLSAVHKLEPQKREEGAEVQKKSSRQESHEAEQPVGWIGVTRVSFQFLVGGILPSYFCSFLLWKKDEPPWY